LVDQTGQDHADHDHAAVADEEAHACEPGCTKACCADKTATSEEAHVCTEACDEAGSECPHHS